jgi:RHS repeat-associated protein
VSRAGDAGVQGSAFMNAYERRRRLAPVIWLMIFSMAMPPAWMSSAFATSNLRLSSFSRDTKLETFRNPQFSGSNGSRFLGTVGPQSLIGSGGDSFRNPDTRGYGSVAEPAAHWISYKGRVEWTDNDLRMPGVGLPLIFQRIYRGSVATYDGPLGHEWEFNWNKRIEYDTSGGTTRAWFYELGRREEYPYSGGSYSSPIGRYDTLTRTGTPEYVRTDREGIVETYEQEPGAAASFRLKEIEDLDSNTLTFFYDSDSILTKVTDTLARDTTLAHDSNGRITSITDSASRVWTYAYDGSGYLTAVRTPIVDVNGNNSADPGDFLSGKTTTYKYDGSNRLTEVARPGDGGTGKWIWAYDGSGRITKETRSGKDITLAYDDTNHNVTVTDRMADKTVYWYDNGHEGNLITKRQVYWDATHYYETTFAYDSAGNVTSVVFPKGNILNYTFDGSGNVLTVQFKKDAIDGGPITWHYTWVTNARLSTLQDPNGNVWDYNYDGSGNLTTKTAPSVTLPDSAHGTIVETWAYNSSGQVTRHTDPCGTITDTSYTTVNSKSAYADQITRDSGMGKLNLITDYNYDSAGNVTSVTDPRSNTTTYTVNALNQVVQAVEPLSVTKTTIYDANDRVITTTASNDTTVGNGTFTVVKSYDAQDNLTSVVEDLTSGASVTTAYAYDDNDRLTKVTSPVGNETVYGYDSRDLQTSVTRKAASSPNDAVAATVYDENGNRVTVTDPNGNNTVYAYDGYDRLTQTTRPQGNYVTDVLDASGNVLTRSHYNVGATKLVETVLSYDEDNRLYQTDTLAKKADLSTNIGDGTQTKTIHRDEMGRVLSHSGDVCGCSLYEHVYDAVGRQVTSKDPMGVSDPTRNLVVSEYDANGNVTKSTRKERSQATGVEADKDIITEFVFDARNRMVTRKERLDLSTTMDTVYSYGVRDQLTRVVDGNGDEKRFEHNERLWKTKEILENGAADVVTEYTYDNDGRLLTYTAKNSTTGDQNTVYTYDKLDRVVTAAWPVGGSHVYTYDKAGNRISTTDPNGTVTVGGYDSNNRLTSRTMSLATNVVGATSHAFGYDGMNRMTSADSSEGMSFSTAIVRTFNTLGKIETEKQVIDGYNSGAGRTITYAWDEEGNKVSTTYPVGGTAIAYTRDALDRVDQITRAGSQVIDYTWNGGRVIKSEYPGSHTTMLYDGYGRVTDIHHKDTSSGHTLARFTYGYDSSSQIIAWDRYYYDDVNNTRITGNHLDEGYQFSYDGAKRLVSVLRGVATADITKTFAANVAASPQAYRHLIEYKLDPTGNRLTRQLDGSNDVTYAHNMANEMTTEGANTLTYNNNGDWTGTSNEYRYAWNDQFGRYIKAGSPAVTYTWHYDALGRRVEFEDSSFPTRTQRYYYDGDQMVEVARWSGSAETALKQFVFGDRLDDLVMYVDVANNLTYYAHKDHLGSVAALVDSSGAIQEGYRYNEYGETTIVDNTFAKLTTTTTSPVGCPYRYTGREEHNSVGAYGDDWYYYRAREYRPEAGEFIQRDSVIGSANSRYMYADGRPIINIDPFGKDAVHSDQPVGNFVDPRCPNKDFTKDVANSADNKPGGCTYISCSCPASVMGTDCMNTVLASKNFQSDMDKLLPPDLQGKKCDVICINQEWYGNMNKQNYCQKNQNNVTHKKCPSFMYTMAHEFGHVNNNSGSDLAACYYANDMKLCTAIQGGPDGEQETCYDYLNH